MFKKGGKLGFTLVELIVVITIIAILGTIAFISLEGYSQNARDSVRVSDIGKMKTGLDLFYLDAGKYPEITDGFIVSYSESEVWTQGTFGKSTLGNIKRLDKIPSDPLTEKEYTYSVTKDRQEYQFAGIMEGDGMVLNSNLGQANAGDILTTALVTGTYNGMMIKTLSGTRCDILALPSIISSETSEVNDLIQILNSKSLVYNGYKNLPTNYISSKYNSKGGFDFDTDKFVAYTDTGSCLPLLDGEDNTARTDLVEGLIEAYDDTIIKNIDGIENIIDTDLSDPNIVDIIGVTIINNDLGGKLKVPSTQSSDGNSGGEILDISCTGLVGSVNNGEGYDNYDLCSNQVEIVLTGEGKNIPFSNNLDGEGGITYNVYGTTLFSGQTYTLKGTQTGDCGEGLCGEDDFNGYIYLFDSFGNEIISEDPSCGEGCYHGYNPIIITPLETAVYYVVVTSYIGDFTYNIDVPEPKVLTWYDAPFGGLFKDFNYNSFSFNNNLIFNAKYISPGEGDASGYTDDTNVLRITDGSYAGTTVLANLYSEGVNQYAQYYTTVNGKMIFATRGEWGGINEALWVSDGTKEGTFKLRDYYHIGEEWKQFVAFNNKIYFSAAENNNDYGLGVTDGTIIGTEYITNVDQDNYIQDIYGTDNKLIIIYSKFGVESVKYIDLSDNSLKDFKDINNINLITGKDFIDYNGYLYYISNGNLYKTNTDNTSTELITNQISNIELVFNGKLYFRYANDLYVTDGSVAGTHIADFYNSIAGSTLVLPEIGDLFVHNSELYFAVGNNPEGENVSIWKTNGTIGGNKLVASDIIFGNPGIGTNMREWVSRYHIINGNLYFMSQDWDNVDLWSNDGSVDQKTFVADVQDHETYGAIRFFHLDGNVYFDTSVDWQKSIKGINGDGVLFDTGLAGGQEF